MISLKQLLIPFGVRKIDAAKTWTVRWRSYRHHLDFDGTEYVEVFVTKKEADEFAEAIEKAFKLVKQKSNIDVDVSANQ